MFGDTKRRKSDTQGDLTGCPQLQRAFNYGQEPNTQHTLFCREISFVTSYAHMRGGGSQKVTSDDEGEGGGGSGYPPKKMTSFVNSPLPDYEVRDKWERR